MLYRYSQGWQSYSYSRIFRYISTSNQYSWWDHIRVRVNFPHSLESILRPMPHNTRLSDEYLHKFLKRKLIGGYMPGPRELDIKSGLNFIRSITALHCTVLHKLLYVFILTNIFVNLVKYLNNTFRSLKKYTYWSILPGPEIKYLCGGFIFYH